MLFKRDVGDQEYSVSSYEVVNVSCFDLSEGLDDGDGSSDGEQHYKEHREVGKDVVEALPRFTHPAIDVSLNFLIGLSAKCFWRKTRTMFSRSFNWMV